MRVVLGEDLFLLREGMEHLLTAHGCTVVASVGTAPELLRALLDERPDVAVVDVRLPPSFSDEGIQVALEARRRVPGLPVLVLSQYVEQLYARELLADGAGSVGYLLKDRVLDTAQFIEALRRVAGGGTAMDPKVVERLLHSGSRREPLERLTPRELEVLGLMAEGRSNAAIAGSLCVTDKAIDKHINNIFSKLQLLPSKVDNRRVQAVLAYLTYVPAHRPDLARPARE
ncbi:DNA-binding response regulator [Streptomyces sp. CB02923]|uniref:response regulator transcription factor n=1 Tax=Streptomyces sp. CB02923 TaxID=1718985 RepID=UPI00093E7816|nr:response regulator transcription factor [Streptomyces sp. CB02923]OKI00433.1 DNA-binding response regulator [Streptomyces sp. CB02923]